MSSKTATPTPLPCRAKRIAAGVSVKAIAKRLGCSPAYLAHCERHGFTGVLRERVADLGIYPNCGRKDFLRQPSPTPGEPVAMAGGGEERLEQAQAA